MKARKRIAAGELTMPSKPARGVDISCITCGKPVYRTQAELIRRGQYCSRACRYTHARGSQVEKTCPRCQKVFAVPRCKVSQVHCSQHCEKAGRIARPLDRTHNGRPARLSHAGYVMVWEPDRPGSLRGWYFEHRLVMEASIGRCLAKDEVIHHVSGDKQDNSLSNLTIMRARAHAALSSQDYHASVAEKLAKLAAYEARFGPLTDD